VTQRLLFDKRNVNSALGELPGGLAPGETGSDDGDMSVHGRDAADSTPLRRDRCPSFTAS
jgi:hypothetical protein